MYDDAYRLVLDEIQDEETTATDSADIVGIGVLNLVRLMGRTGVIVGWLEENTLIAVLDVAVKVLL